MLKAGTSIGANYRAACRARSKAEFFAKICIVVEESDEAVYWLEILYKAEILPYKELEEELAEANELMKIFSSSRKTAKLSSSKQHN